MAFDSVRGRSVLFGGWDGASVFNDTWEFVNRQWTQVAQGPMLARGCAALAFDAARGRSVLFGGFSGAFEFNDTWLWDGSAWQSVNPLTSPSGRDSFGMVYDSGRGRIVLFGGHGSSGLLNDTWEWDGTNWSQVLTANAPSPRHFVQMAYDSAIGRTVLFGGEGGPSGTDYFNDTWEFDGTNWVQMNPTAMPAPTALGVMDFDTGAGHSVLFGGGFTYWFDGAASSWQLISTDSSPGSRNFASMAYDTVADVSRLFGGSNGTYQNDTWETPAAPVATLSASTLDFGSVALGTTSQPLSATVTNTGTAPLHLTGVTISQVSAFTKTADSCTGASLSPLASCTASFTFQPVAAVFYSVPVYILDDAIPSPQILTLSGTGTGPTIGFNSQLAFGSERVGTSTSMHVFLTNSGNSDGHITSTAIQGSNASEFQLSNNQCSGATIAPSASCSMLLDFSPATIGSKTAQLVVTSDAYNSPQIAQISGTGVEGLATISPSSIDFGSVLAGTTSAATRVSVTNTGNDYLAISSIGFAGGNASSFVVQSDSCSGTSLATGAVCVVAVAFSPREYGNVFSSLEVNSDAGNGIQFVQVTGLGLSGHPSFNPTSVNFGNVHVNNESQTQTVVVTNVGNSRLHISSVTIQGLNAANFVKTKDTCTGATLAPGATCTFVLGFRPRAIGEYTAFVAVADDDPTGPGTQSLMGFGVKS